MRSHKPEVEPDLASVRDKAVELLARREHTRLELKRKLRKRELPNELIQQVLDELVATDVLSEARYAEALVHSRLSRGFGPLRILAEAQESGADEALIHAALESAEPDWFAVAQSAQQQRFGRSPKDLDERVKQSRFLAGRGFTADTVRQVIGDIYD